MFYVILTFSLLHISWAKTNVQNLDCSMPSSPFHINNEVINAMTLHVYWSLEITVAL